MSKAPPRPTRRRLLKGAAGVAVVGVTGVAGLKGFERATIGPAWGRDLPFITAQEDFYTRFQAKKLDPMFWWVQLTQPGKYPMVEERPDVPWRMKVNGAVKNPLDLGEADVRAIADAAGPTSYLKTLRCTGDIGDRRLASNGLWTGVPLQVLLDKAEISSRAQRLYIHGEDGFTCNLRMDSLNGADGRPSILAHSLNSEPLIEARGGPFRLIVPDRFGFKNIKWPVRIEARADDVSWGNHEVDVKAAVDDGTVTVGTKLLDPDIVRQRHVARTKDRELTLRGVAFGGVEPVTGVAVSVDRGAWQEARLHRPAELDEDPAVRAALESVGGDWPVGDVWAPWWFSWTAPGPGTYWIQVKVSTASMPLEPEAPGMASIENDPRMVHGFIRVV